MSNYEAGRITEDYFVEKMKLARLDWEYIDDWYDFEIEGQKVEVKSCRLTIKAHQQPNKTTKRVNMDCYRVGRFDFTKEETREKIHDQNCWVCFIVRDHEECMMLGFIEGRKLDPKQRYISIHHIRNLELVSLDTFKELIKK